jgi:hypothetical protein
LLLIKTILERSENFATDTFFAGYRISGNGLPTTTQVGYDKGVKAGVDRRFALQLKTIHRHQSVFFGWRGAPWAEGRRHFANARFFMGRADGK